MATNNPAHSRLAVLAPLALSLFSCATADAQDGTVDRTRPVALAADVPRPASVLGHEVGADFFLASYDEALAYFKVLDRASEEVQLVRVGETSFGLPWYVALISSAENLANLDAHVDRARRLALVEGLDDDAARALAAAGPAIVHIDGGLHSTEAACPQHTIQLAYELCARDDAEVRRIKEDVILVLWFSINPDGQNMVSGWYRRNLGTPFEVASLPWLYQKYVGHDNNRDGYMNNTLEQQVVTRVTLEYWPQVFYNHHQTAPFPARIWIPPFAEPISRNAHPLMWRWVNVFGTRMAAYLEDRGHVGAIHRGTGFDDWYPGFIDHVNSYRNTVSFLTETALYRYATPHFYTLSDFPRDKRELRPESFYSSPWRGGWWRLGDAVRYQIEASMAVLDTASRYRDEVQYNRYQAGRDTIRRYSEGPPYAYLIPREQWDGSSASALVRRLQWNGIRVEETQEAFSTGGLDYPSGAHLVPMDQPFAQLVRELFEVQDYPELRVGENLDLPYDVAGWTLPLQMGVEAVPAMTPLTDDTLSLFEEVPRPESLAVGPATRDVDQGTLWLSHRENASFLALNGAWEDRDAYLASHGGEPGAIALVPRGADAPSAQAISLGRPRVGVFRPWRTSMDAGWTRWLLDTYGAVYDDVRPADVRAGHLDERWDVLVFADMGRGSIVDGHAAGTMPPEFVGGVGEEGLAALRAFVEDGGTLVCFDGSANFAIDLLDLDVSNGLADLTRDEFFCGGSLLQCRVEDPEHPLTMGMPEDPVVMFAGSPAFETGDEFRGTTLMSWPEHGELLRSGFLIGGEQLAGKAAMLEAVHGDGRAVLFGFRPQWRGQTFGTFKLIFNALLYTQAVTAQLPAAEGREADLHADWEAARRDVHVALARLRDASAAWRSGAEDPVTASAVVHGLADALDDRERDVISELADRADATSASLLAEYTTRLDQAVLRCKSRSDAALPDSLAALLATFGLDDLEERIGSALR